MMLISTLRKTEGNEKSKKQEKSKQFARKKNALIEKSFCVTSLEYSLSTSGLNAISLMMVPIITHSSSSPTARIWDLIFWSTEKINFSDEKGKQTWPTESGLVFHCRSEGFDSVSVQFKILMRKLQAISSQELGIETFKVGCLSKQLRIFCSFIVFSSQNFRFCKEAFRIQLLALVWILKRSAKGILHLSLRGKAATAVTKKFTRLLF